MLENLKKRVLQANLDLVKHGLVILTWGNVSMKDPETGLILIKPSGIDYEHMKTEDIVILDMDGKVVEGKRRPSSDTPTHLVLYRNFTGIGAIVHTHSEWATSWAQAGRNMPAYGASHADYFYGKIPCTTPLTPDDIRGDYETATGEAIVQAFLEKDYKAMPGVLVHGHGPFTWGKSPEEAVVHATVLEEICKLAFRTEMLGNRRSMDQYLLDRHYSARHVNDEGRDQ